MRAPLTTMIFALVTWGAVQSVLAQSCDTHEPCMTDGMCMPDGSCQGTPVNGGSCDVVSADATCKVATGTCVNGRCRADAAPVGTSCAAGCGTCQLAGPGGNTTICMTSPGHGGQACDPGLGACFPGTCSMGPFALCTFALKPCPDIDNNPCTADFCNLLTGECQHSDLPPCVETCETCNPSTGQCEPANEGVACSGATECTAEGHCERFDIGGVVRGLCMPGAGTPTSPTPTVEPTATAVSGEPTSTATAVSAQCEGDCAGVHQVTISNLIVLVNIALGMADTSSCVSGVPNGATVDIAFLVRAVGNALNGCPVS